MPKDKEFFRQGANLAQQLAIEEPIYAKLAGSDPETSESIGFFLMLGKHELIDLEQPSMKLFMDLLDVRRKAKFATSERNNEITKMGMQMPKADAVYFDE